jgi:hypothetical protein
MQSKTIWFDCDGVLLDWTRPFLNYIGATERYEDLTQYDLSNLFGGDKAAMREKIYEFNNGDEYAFLAPLVAADYLEDLKNKGYKLKIITQCEGFSAKDSRLSNLRFFFGYRMFEDIIFTHRGQNKAELLRSMEPYETITVIEDNPQFFKDASLVGGFKGYAIEHPYNKEALESLPEIHRATLINSSIIFTSTKAAIEYICNS